MNRKELFCLLILILVLITINIVSYRQWSKNKETVTIMVQKEKIQISINRADADELEMLPGIGRVMANRIIEFREKNGEFKDLTDLVKVKGISERTLEKIKPYVKL